MHLSLVATLYNSAPHLFEFYERMTKCAQQITHDYEMILVNDGSPDSSLDLALKLFEKAVTSKRKTKRGAIGDALGLNVKREALTAMVWPISSRNSGRPT